jgi:adenosylcobinamide kinase / adenosylcobinamide-phosphate guanylyltransferase
VLTLVIGGISGGKSRYAVDLARTAGGDVLFIATGQASDPEMAARIAAHRGERPEQWLVAEEPLRLDEAARAHPGVAAILIDSVDGLVANRMESEGGAGTTWRRALLDRLEGECVATVERLPEESRIVCVTSEVGLTMVPLHPYGRAFADLLGRVNQRLAALADDVWLVVAGVPFALRRPPVR